MSSTSVGDEARDPDPDRRTVAWVVACGLAEAVGLTAAAGAARLADDIVDRPDGSVVLAWLTILAAGLVEGVALGSAQATVLRVDVPALRVLRYVTATVLVAGLGWSLGALPSVLAADDGDAGPPWLVMLLAGAALGLAMGAALGLAQAWAMCGAVRRARVWVAAGAVAWTPAMALVMVGAGMPGEQWPIAGVLAWACLTGSVAGGVLGAVLSVFVPRLGPGRGGPG